MTHHEKTYPLLGADGRPYRSPVKGRWGGHRGTKVYGRLDCPAALRAIARGAYVKHRVFFADEATAIGAGYRPCGTCCKDRYRAWTNAQQRRRVSRTHSVHDGRTRR
jgi:methylphosphotriester-DNA--protein-cysteine methyltransferase